MHFPPKLIKQFSNVWLNKALAFSQRPAPPPPERTGRYPNFDILRLLLAVEVAFVHAWDAVDPNFNWPGYVMAVPAFLAISGFLVLQSYTESGSWCEFLKKRVLRVFPALTVSFVLCYFLLDISASFNSFILWLSGGLYYFPGSRNVPLWSLAWEELAYLCLALLWALGAYKKPFWIWLLLLLSICLVWAVSDLEPHNKIIFFLAPAFFIGNLMFLYRGSLLAVSPYVPWVVFYVMIQWRHVPDSNLFGGAFLLALQAFAVVWAGISGLKVIRFKFPDLSYGVYIYHFPIILFIKQNYNITDLNEILLFTAVILIPFSAASWYLIEKPMLRLKKRRILS